MSVHHPRLRVDAFIRDELMAPMGWTCAELAQATGIPATLIGQVVEGRAAITVGMDRCLCRYFSMPDGYLLRLQRAQRMAEALDPPHP